MNEKPEMETLREVWPGGADAAHYHWEIGPDRDGLGCVEVRLNEEGKIKDRITFPPDVAKLVAQAIQLAAQEVGTTTP